MKKTVLIGLGACALALGGVTGLLSHAHLLEARADGVVGSGDTVYLKISDAYWGQGDSTFAIYSWGKGTSTFTPMTKVDDDLSKVYKVTIPVGDTSIIFVRYSKGSAMDSWVGRQNQSRDITLSDSTSNLWVNTSWGKNSTGEGDDWGGNWSSATYKESADMLSLTIYAGKTSAATYCYAWDKSGPLTGSFPGSPMDVTSKTTAYQGTSLYKKTIGYTSHMSDRSDVTLKMVLSIGTDKDKSADIEVVLDGYYYSPNGEHWYDGTPAADGNKGIDAALTWDLDKADICHLSTSQADTLRNRMDGNKGYVTSATWNGYNYNAAYDLVDSQCTTPKAAGSFAVYAAESSDGMIPTIVTFASIAVLASLVSLFYFHKKKSEE